MDREIVKSRTEAFDGIICSREVLKLTAERTYIILGIIEDVEKQPEKPIVYVHTFTLADSSTYLPQSKAALKVGHKVRVPKTFVSSDNIPYITNIEVDTSELAREYLAELAKRAAGQ